MTTPTLGALALGYAERGWHVFPVAPNGKAPAIPTAHPAGDPMRGVCKGECGRLGHGLYDATLKPDQIRHWWGYCPNANIGINAGASGLVILDLDAGKDQPEQVLPDQGDEPTPQGVHTGADVFAWLSERVGGRIEFDTYAVRTPSGGEHFYYQQPDPPIGSNAGRLGWAIDVRGVGGSIIAAGSRRDGRAYVFAGNPDPAPLPAWIARLLAPKPRPPRTGAAPDFSGANGSRYLVAALRGEIDAVLKAAPGTRNDTLNRAAFNLGQVAAQRGLPLDAVRAMLIDAGHEIGLEAHEVAGTVDSGLRAGQAQPRRT